MRRPWLRLRAALVTGQFLLLHGPDNQSYWIAPDKITTMREPLPSDLERSFSRRTKCIIVTTTGKFVAVTESCPEVYKLIQMAR